MKRVLFRPVDEPTGTAYDELIDHACDVCASFGLVVQPRTRIDGEAEQVLASLEPWLISSAPSRSWPGTELIGGQAATVYEYRCDPGARELLKQSSRALFGWLHPRRPEDLHFLRADRSVWLASIAHERDAYLELTEDERVELMRELPWTA